MSKFNNRYSEQDCIESLQQAAEKLGKSPSRSEYNNLNISPSAATLYRKFGSWNNAKEIANIKQYEPDCKNNEPCSKQDCIESLQEAAELLGKSPTALEYDSLDLLPHQATISDKFGGWNNAKESANLETYSKGAQICKIPSLLNVSFEEWENFPPEKRSRLKRRTKLDRLKISTGCLRCGYDENPRAIHFHHTNPEEKSFSISQEYICNHKPWDRVKEEIKKCEIICANCHGIETSDDGLLKL